MPNFNDGLNWDLAYEVSFTANRIGSLIIPIEDFTTPLLNSPYILLFNQVLNPKQTWRYLGNVRSTAQSNFFNAVIDRYSLEINEFQIIRIKDLKSYRLSFDVNNWIPNVRIKLWEYIGLDVDTRKDIDPETRQKELTNEILLGLL